MRLPGLAVQVPDCLVWFAGSVLLCLTLVPRNVAAQTWKSGQDSPVHDSDRLLPLSGKTISIEDDEVRLSFDQGSGALLEFLSKKTGWNLLEKKELAKSFRIRHCDRRVANHRRALPPALLRHIEAP
jgi:hypothetical protein